MASMVGFISLRSSIRSMSVADSSVKVVRSGMVLDARLTGDVVIEDVILFDGVIDELLGCRIEDQNFPLYAKVRKQGRTIASVYHDHLHRRPLSS